MEQSQYLIDSNAVIDYLGNKLPPKGMKFMNSVIDAIPNISIITKIEVLSFNASDEDYQLLSNFIHDSCVLDLGSGEVEMCIELRKKHKTKLPDAIIAATAIANEFSLITRNVTDFITRNVTDFKNIDGLKVINPYNL